MRRGRRFFSDLKRIGLRGRSPATWACRYSQFRVVGASSIQAMTSPPKSQNAPRTSILFRSKKNRPSRTVAGDLGLQVLAVQSGGRVFNPSNDLTTEIPKCAADADSFYVLSFNARPADRANEYHALSVTVDKPGITARTRTGYYAQP